MPVLRGVHVGLVDTRGYPKSVEALEPFGTRWKEAWIRRAEMGDAAAIFVEANPGQWQVMVDCHGRDHPHATSPRTIGSLIQGPDSLVYDFMKRRVQGSATDGSCEQLFFDPASVARARRAMPDKRAVTLTSEAFAVLSHPARLRLLLALDGRELCVCDCSQVLDASLSGTSQHLKELRRMGAITFRAEGKMAYYRLADHRWLAIAEAALQAVQTPAADQETA